MAVIHGGVVIAGAGQRVISKTIGSPAVGAAAAVHAAVTDTGAQQTVTTAITSPDVPRTVTATAGGTAADIKAIQVTVNGTDANGNAISEALPAFTVDTAGTVQGAKAFATVTSIVIPAHDGVGATTSVGTGDKLGLGVALSRNTVVGAYFGGALEATAPAVTVNATDPAGNVVDLNSTLDGSAVIVDYYEG